MVHDRGSTISPPHTCGEADALALALALERGEGALAGGDLTGAVASRGGDGQPQPSAF